MGTLVVGYTQLSFESGSMSNLKSIKLSRVNVWPSALVLNHLCRRFRSRILCIFFRLFRRHRLYIERRSNFCCQLCCEKPLLTQQHRLQIVWHYPTPGRFRKTILMFHILDDMTARSLLEFNVVPTCLNSQLNHGDPKLLNREVGDTFSGVHCLNMGVSQN